MPLTLATPIAFIPTQGADAARSFYEDTLGLHFESDDGFALVFRAGAGAGSGLMVRIFRTQDLTPATHTVFGWTVDDLDAVMIKLKGKGITFLVYPFLTQDAHGVWQTPGGPRIAWFQDPDGNVLSVSQD